MYDYFAIYPSDPSDPPAGIIVMGYTKGDTDALAWDHFQQAWVYAPSQAVQFLDNPRNGDRFRRISREQAEETALLVSRGEKLPDEATIAWIFQWKGSPPQGEDIGA
jgi:hypothetical protein